MAFTAGQYIKATDGDSAETDGGAIAPPLFAYSAGFSTTSVTPVPITGCSLTVEDDTFYAVDIWILSALGSSSPGDISTSGTAVFSSILLALSYDGNGALAGNSRPSAFTFSALAPDGLLHFTGTIQVTTLGTVILDALSINGPSDAFAIDEVRMTLTPIGTV